MTEKKIDKLQNEINNLCDKYGILAYGMVVFDNKDGQVTGFNSEKIVKPEGYEEEHTTFIQNITMALVKWLDFLQGDESETDPALDIGRN